MTAGPGECNGLDADQESVDRHPKTGTVHFGIDNYFSIADNKNNPYMISPDVGVTVGALKYLGFGFDLIEPSADPLFFNLKAGLPESGSRPAPAVGAFNLGM